MENIKGGGRVSALHCVLWIDDTVIYETSPAFAITNSQQLQGTGMWSPQAGSLLTLGAMKDWTQGGVFATELLQFSLLSKYFLYTPEKLVNKNLSWATVKKLPLKMI